MLEPSENNVGLALICRGQFPLHPYHDLSLLGKLVRDALLNGGLGVKDADAPLVDIIEPGMTVLLKPNWVLHYNKSGKTMDCMITHPNFILCVLKEVLKGKPSKILIGDAPIQNADFDSIMATGSDELLKFAASYKCIEIRDLRNLVSQQINGEWIITHDLRPRERSVSFDLGQNSMLEPVSLPSGRFRNTNYNPDDMVNRQSPGIHEYSLCKEPFEADVIINLPKLKAHGKAGITAALKNIVGFIADKNYLPHHRVGGSRLGGDCYPGLNIGKRLAEYFLDQANRNKTGRTYHFLKSMSNIMLMPSSTSDKLGLEGVWYGNDTVWRMVLDLNRILLYGNIDGKLSNTPLRTIFTLTDGIIAGERNGPLAPEPVRLGAITFGTNSAFIDIAHSALMRFDWNSIPLIRESFKVKQHPLAHEKPEELLIADGKEVYSFAEAAKELGVDFEPPLGWKGHIEFTRH
jgi:uncharacterized protein (DUF362 family)